MNTSIVLVISILPSFKWQFINLQNYETRSSLKPMKTLDKMTLRMNWSLLIKLPWCQIKVNFVTVIWSKQAQYRSVSLWHYCGFTSNVSMATKMLSNDHWEIQQENKSRLKTSLKWKSNRHQQFIQRWRTWNFILVFKLCASKHSQWLRWTICWQFRCCPSEGVS